ncbi:hypothetical protein [Nocardia sp. NPDC005366]|uniref:hypothetical protein n=1 Tax=Nocardia sp. NPDC005366 TaxID=3156878 RepID=UPI0033A7A2C0
MKATKYVEQQHDTSDAVVNALIAIVSALVKVAAVLAWWVLLFPMVSIPLVLAVTVGVLLGPVAGVVVVGVFAAGMVLWRRRGPQTFERWITRRARTRFLSWFRYRLRWARLLTACGLSVTNGEHTFVPRLLAIEIGAGTDLVRLRMLPGHCPDDYRGRAVHLAHAFGAQGCAATIVGPGVVELVFRRAGAVADPITLPRPATVLRWDEKEAA